MLHSSISVYHKNRMKKAPLVNMDKHLSIKDPKS